MINIKYCRYCAFCISGDAYYCTCYRSPEIDTAGKLAAQELIDNVADWLTDEKNLPTVDEVQVQKISRADTCALISEDEDGATFQGSFALEYFKTC